MSTLHMAAKAKATIEPLRAGGHSCADCSFYQPRPFALGGKGRYCDYHSDGGAYAITKPDDICPDHKTTLSSSLKAIAAAEGEA
jgi:hypothetical protein